MIAALIAALATQGPADLVVTHARVWTDGAVSTADTIAIKGGRFVFIGKGNPELVGPATKVVNARGRVVIPGLIDSHTHLVSGGVSLLQLQLREAANRQDFIARVKTYAERQPAGKWIVGRGWSAESWPDRQQPTKNWIDAATGDKPAYLVRMDGHSVLVNSAALAAAGITKDTPNPAGGVIDKDPQTGEPTGMLRETAMSLVKVPSPTDEDRYQGLLAAIQNANRHGITAVSDICPSAQFPIVHRYARGARPTLRFALYSRVAGTWDSEIASAKLFPPVYGWAEVKGLKAFMDGSLGSRTAFMREPFTKPLPDQKELRGVPMPGAVDGTYAAGFKRAAEAGLQVIVHAIGDQANHDLLNLYSTNVPGLNNRRFRVEHVQHLLPEDISRFASLGVIPSMQPYHKADDGRYCEEVIGHERSRTSYAFRALIASGARLAFGSDWPVVTLDPFEAIETAVNGRIMTGQIWMPHQNITVHEALQCYTANSAYAMGWEDQIGRIATGYRADFVILNRSPIDRGANFPRIKPASVYVDGRSVYEADGPNR